MKALDILLVEDNPGDARLTREALAVSKVRNTLHHARDGEERSRFCATSHPYERAAAGPGVARLESSTA
jgi:hypothetical protein